MNDKQLEKGGDPEQHQRVHLVAETLFDAGDLEVSRELLGTEHVLNVRGYEVSMHIPSRPDEFRKVFIPGFDTARDAVMETDDSDIARITTLRISVPFATEDAPYLQIALSRFDPIVQISYIAAAQVLGWIRVNTWQVWLLPTGEKPRLLGKPMIYRRDGRRVPSAMDGYFNIPDRTTHHPLNRGILEQGLRKVTEDAVPPVAESLLADALLLIERAEALELTRQPILLAAIACETKTRELFPQKKWAAAPIRVLLHEQMEAAYGRSLKSARPEVFAAISDLFTLRNRIAHRGAVAEDFRRAHALISAVKSFFDWWDQQV